MYVLALNERDHYALADIATRSVRTVASEVLVPSIVCYFRGGSGSTDANIVLTWDKKHRADARDLTKAMGCAFSPNETHALARAAEEDIEHDNIFTWVARKRETTSGAWLLDEREALASRPKLVVGSKTIPTVKNGRGFAWSEHETSGITIGGLLAYFRLVPYLCVFPDEPMRVTPDPE